MHVEKNLKVIRSSQIHVYSESNQFLEGINILGNCYRGDGCDYHRLFIPSEITDYLMLTAYIIEKYVVSLV